MVRNWKLNLIRPSDAVMKQFRVSWGTALKDLQAWMRSDLVHALVYGGMGLQGIAQTPFYKWISSAEGLSQLGIEKTEPPKLLMAYERTIKITRSKNLIKMKFGDIAELKTATPHPASGTGHLQIESWLEWVFDGLQVQSGFVPREKIPKGSQRSIRINSAPGGLMLPKDRYGSTGVWRFPTQLADFERRWIQTNVPKIEKLVSDRAALFLTKNLK